MKQAKDILIVICLVLFTAILSPWAWYSLTMARAAKDAAIHADGLVGEARLAAKNSVQASKDTDTAMQNLNGVVTKVGALVTKFGATADAATGTITKAGTLVSHVDADVTKAEKPAAETKRKIDAAIDAYASVPPRLNAALEPLPAFEQSLTRTSDAAGNFINNPFLNRAVENVATLAGNAAEITDNTNNYFFPPPYSGPHPILHRAKRIGEGALKLAPGLAGGIAIAKGN